MPTYRFILLALGFFYVGWRLTLSPLLGAQRLQVRRLRGVPKGKGRHKLLYVHRRVEQIRAQAIGLLAVATR